MPDAKPAELPVRLFRDGAAREAWPAKQHAKSAGLWLRIAKASSNVKSDRYAILFRIQTVKRAETRAKKIEQFVGINEG